MPFNISRMIPGVIVTRASLIGFFSLLLLSVTTDAAPRLDVVVPQPESATDSRSGFPEKLLRLALARSCPTCRVTQSRLVMLKPRAFIELAKTDGMVNVVWATTSQEREQRYLPIRIPIYKGLMGWRIPLVTPQTERRLAKVRNKADLEAFRFGQGKGWPDADILRSNHLMVQEVAGYDALFHMLGAGRFDLMPHSVIEIEPEAAAFAKDGLIVDTHIVLHYPDAFYYFVNRENTELAELLRKGLQMIRTDGSFDRLLLRTFGAALHNAHIERRLVIELDNPLLPASARPRDPGLWLDLCPNSCRKVWASP
jgi:hypothetical protein